LKRQKKYWCDEEHIAHYTCYKVKEKFIIDGNLDKNPWRIAPRSPRFVDMVTGIPGFLKTNCAALWDEETLYIAFWIQEPNIVANLTNRDDRVCLFGK